ncbi:hypothetical protein HNP55_004021 [Paucibacter oligotrophus]|uniref:Ice-binding protein C-terminal domain-containing protein n=1 Tax=Roseateles oligotrophus TaxID=1769250 RepID=A0A840LCL6_9BURK|nr:PEP-CTERM sorting domain-containing protein [Roseateles oligotrophus]MBB4845471.1 hypothetical protein [Roseateles oligotrophus]
MKKIIHNTLALSALVLAVTHASAATNLVKNGSMNGMTGNSYTNYTAPTNWSFITPGGERWKSYGATPSPEGGDYFGVMSLKAYAPRFSVGGLTQSISGLVVGQTYDLSFYSMSNHTNSGAWDHWDVSLGDSAAKSGVNTQPGLGWKLNNMQFTASATTQQLKFLAVFGAGANPEILNLDGVSLTAAAAVPEPSSYALMLGGLIGIGALISRRKQQG